MALEPDDMKFAIEDVRRRISADVDLIASIDKQALSFLTLFVTLTAAGFTGGGGVLLTTSKAYPLALGVGLISFGIFTFVAAMLCVQVLWADDISLPGRDADFWLWADREDVGASTAYRQYLSHFSGKAEQNRALNRRMSNTMQSAKQAGAAAPFIGLAAALIAHQII